MSLNKINEGMGGKEVVLESKEQKLKKVWEKVWIKVAGLNAIAGNVSCPSDLYNSRDYTKKELGKEVMTKMMNEVYKFDPDSGMMEQFIKSNFSGSKQYWQDLIELVDEHRPEDVKLIFDHIDNYCLGKYDQVKWGETKQVGLSEINNWKKIIGNCLSSLKTMKKRIVIEYMVNRYLKNKEFDNKDLADLLIESRISFPLVVNNIFIQNNDNSFVKALEEAKDLNLFIDINVRKHLLGRGHLSNVDENCRMMDDHDLEQLHGLMIENAYQGIPELDEYKINHSISMGKIAKQIQREINVSIYARNALGLIDAFSKKEIIKN